MLKMHNICKNLYTKFHIANLGSSRDLCTRMKLPSPAIAMGIYRQSVENNGSLAKALAQALVLCRGTVWAWAWVTCPSSSHQSIIIIAMFFILCTYLAHNFLSPSWGGSTRGNALLRFQEGKWKMGNRK